MAIVDFTNLPPIPSTFDPEWGALRRPLIFLHRFVAQLSDHARLKHEQVDYVPTQVVTEYLLHASNGGDDIAGLLYSSSLTGEPSAVLDVPNKRCVWRRRRWPESDGTQLGLDKSSVRTRQLTAADRRRVRRRER